MRIPRVNKFINLASGTRGIVTSFGNQYSFIQIFVLWLILRLITSIYAAWLSAKVPLSEIEHLLPVWPPIKPLGLWLDRVLISPMTHWDVVWYLRIVTQGYHSDDGTAQFHPLYPWLAKTISWTGIHPLISLLIVSSVATVFLLYFFEKLAKMDLKPEYARTATLALLFYPLAFILFIPYSEALFILLTIICFYFARKGQWWLAGIAGMLATLTRQQGVFLLFPVAWEIWEASRTRVKEGIIIWRNWLAIGLIPAGLLIWLIYRMIVLSDLKILTGNIQNLIFSLIISPSSNQVVPLQAFLWPWQTLNLALAHLKSYSLDPDLITNLLFGALFLLLVISTWKWMRYSYRIYTLIIVLISLSYYTGSLHPYMGLLRHLYLAFPVFIGLGSINLQPRSRWLAITIEVIGFFFLLSSFVCESWVT